MIWIGVGIAVAVLVGWWLLAVAEGLPKGAARAALAGPAVKPPAPAPVKAAAAKPPEPAARSAPAAGEAAKGAPAAGKASPPAAPRAAAKAVSAANGAALLTTFPDDDEDDDITRVTLDPFSGRGGSLPLINLVKGDDDDGDDLETTLKEEAAAVPILYDEDAAADEPTLIGSLILVSAAAQTDKGLRRRKNEDAFLKLDEHNLFAVADGMGGHRGGEVASRMAVDMIARAFKTATFVGKPYTNVPRRGSELVVAIQMANHEIYEEADANPELEGMGTTVVSARFSPDKQRLYVGHVGDSRCYRLRGEQLRQMTTDHTLGGPGFKGPLADRLTRAVGIQKTVKVDLIIARPVPKDVYLLCSDGLSKMVPDEQIRELLIAHPTLSGALEKLIERANERGGKDNITAILVQVT